MNPLERWAARWARGPHLFEFNLGDPVRPFGSFDMCNNLEGHVRARRIIARFHEITMARRQRELMAKRTALVKQIESAPLKHLMARDIMDQAIASLRFYRCQCGNEQPFIAGRGKPDCESCGRSAPA